MGFLTLQIWFYLWNPVMFCLCCMSSLSFLWLTIGFDLRPSRSFEQVWTWLWVVSLLFITLKIWSKSLFHQASHSVSSSLLCLCHSGWRLMNLIFLFPGVWSFGLYIACDILYSRRCKPEVLFWSPRLVFVQRRSIAVNMHCFGLGFLIMIWSLFILI